MILALHVTLALSTPTLAPPPPPPPGAHEAALGISLSFAFEPRVGSYRDLDATLEDYGYAPVGSPLQLAYGLRGRVHTRGWIVGAAMTYGFRSTRAASNPVPTTTTLFDFGLDAGHQLGLGFYTTLGLSFTALSHSLGSPIDGGALVYLGPAIAPRVGWMFVRARGHAGPFLALSLGYSAQFPIGAAHTQTLWEASFERPVVHAGLFAVESGFALGVERWRWRGGRR